MEERTPSELARKIAYLQALLAQPRAGRRISGHCFFERGLNQLASPAKSFGHAVREGPLRNEFRLFSYVLFWRGDAYSLWDNG